MYRQPDDILIDLFDAPTLRGVIALPPETLSVYVIKTIVPSEIAIIDREKLFALLPSTIFGNFWLTIYWKQAAWLSRGCLN
jgi:hypothetical protein